jgi:hypothetical protein
MRSEATQYSCSLLLFAIFPSSQYQNLLCSDAVFYSMLDFVLSVGIIWICLWIGREIASWAMG